MNTYMIGHTIAWVCISLGILGLLFVAFIKIWDKLIKRYLVHWEDAEGNRSYTIVKTCSKQGATWRALKLHPEIHRVVKVVRND